MALASFLGLYSSACIAVDFNAASAIIVWISMPSEKYYSLQAWFESERGLTWLTDREHSNEDASKGEIRTNPEVRCIHWSKTNAFKDQAQTLQSKSFHPKRTAAKPTYKTGSHKVTSSASRKKLKQFYPTSKLSTAEQWFSAEAVAPSLDLFHFQPRVDTESSQERGETIWKAL